MIEFAWPWLFLLLPLPLLARHWLPPRPGRAGYALPVPFFSTLARLTDRRVAARGHRLRLLLALLAWSLLVTAAARPLWFGRFQDQPTTGRDLMLLVDISGSMRTMDFHQQGKTLSRLEMVKRLAGRFIERREGDRLGLILFGARPYLRAPLTYDRRAVRELLTEAEVALAGEQTAIGDAVGLALKRMRDLPAGSRVLVLLSDGANNQGRLGPVQAAELARELGVRIYTIGIGRERTAGPNPYGAWSARGSDRFGRQLLERLAESTGGTYFHVLDSAGLEAAYRSLDRLEPSLGVAARRALATPLYPWPLALALVVAAGLALPPPGRSHD
ncbi:MAG TPA: VWA domain-containing protein [Sedimenticola sp.]|nr:VWA domain-containing protein [Sedimenticola sp.]